MLTESKFCVSQVSWLTAWGLLEIIHGYPLSVQSEDASGFEVRLMLLSLPSLPTAVPVIWKKVSSFLATFDAETACIAHSFLHL